ncbi:MAG: glycosyltransferase, partial [Jaaginema sp. PMC 1079.18]|nr:glycosyltransferase [Jaaginema sp. PMC 1079.18]
MTPLITVVIPVYNGEKTIATTLQSVLNQTLSELEILIINDGSQDRTLPILQQFQDARIQIHSFPNAGLSASRNRGLKLAQADYLSFIDADDLWTENKLAAQYQALLANPQAAVAYSWTSFINERGDFLYAGRSEKAQGRVYQDLLVYNFLENGSNALIRTQSLKEIGGFDESLDTAEDWDTFLKLAACYDFVNVPQAQILYRISAASMSAQIEKQAQGTLTVIQQAFQQNPNLPQSLKNLALANNYVYLTIKALEGQPNRYRSRLAARYW